MSEDYVPLLSHSGQALQRNVRVHEGATRQYGPAWSGTYGHWPSRPYAMQSCYPIASATTAPTLGPPSSVSHSYGSVGTVSGGSESALIKLRPLCHPIATARVRPLSLDGGYTYSAPKQRRMAYAMYSPFSSANNPDGHIRIGSSDGYDSGMPAPAGRPSMPRHGPHTEPLHEQEGPRWPMRPWGSTDTAWQPQLNFTPQPFASEPLPPGLHMDMDAAAREYGRGVEAARTASPGRPGAAFPVPSSSAASAFAVAADQARNAATSSEAAAWQAQQLFSAPAPVSLPDRASIPLPGLMPTMSAPAVTGSQTLQLPRAARDFPSVPSSIALAAPATSAAASEATPHSTAPAAMAASALPRSPMQSGDETSGMLAAPSPAEAPSVSMPDATQPIGATPPAPVPAAKTHSSSGGGRSEVVPGRGNRPGDAATAALLPPPPPAKGPAAARSLPPPVTVQVASRSKRGRVGPEGPGEEGERITRGVLGVFHPELYMEGGECIECDGEMLGRGRFERLAGCTTAKWHVSIKVLPSGITLGKWLQSHGLPILQSRPRKRLYDLAVATEGTASRGLPSAADAAAGGKQRPSHPRRSTCDVATAAAADGKNTGTVAAADAEVAEEDEAAEAAEEAEAPAASAGRPAQHAVRAVQIGAAAAPVGKRATAATQAAAMAAAAAAAADTNVAAGGDDAIACRPPSAFSVDLPGAIAPAGGGGANTAAGGGAVGGGGGCADEDPGDLDDALLDLLESSGLLDELTVSADFPSEPLAPASREGPAGLGLGAHVNSGEGGGAYVSNPAAAACYTAAGDVAQATDFRVVDVRRAVADRDGDGGLSGGGASGYQMSSGLVPADWDCAQAGLLARAIHRGVADVAQGWLQQQQAQQQQEQQQQQQRQRDVRLPGRSWSYADTQAPCNIGAAAGERMGAERHSGASSGGTYAAPAAARAAAIAAMPFAPWAVGRAAGARGVQTHGPRSFRYGRPLGLALQQGDGYRHGDIGGASAHHSLNGDVALAYPVAGVWGPPMAAAVGRVDPWAPSAAWEDGGSPGYIGGGSGSGGSGDGLTALEARLGHSGLSSHQGLWQQQQQHQPQQPHGAHVRMLSSCGMAAPFAPADAALLSTVNQTPGEPRPHAFGLNLPAMDQDQLAPHAQGLQPPQQQQAQPPQVQRHLPHMQQDSLLRQQQQEQPQPEQQQQQQQQQPWPPAPGLIRTMQMVIARRDQEQAQAQRWTQARGFARPQAWEPPLQAPPQAPNVRERPTQPAMVLLQERPLYGAADLVTAPATGTHPRPLQQSADPRLVAGYQIGGTYGANGWGQA